MGCAMLWTRGLSSSTESAFAVLFDGRSGRGQIKRAKERTMSQCRLFAANYNSGVQWVYDRLGIWLAQHDIGFALAQVESEDEGIEQEQDADIYLAFKFPVTHRVLRHLPRLRLVMSSGNGYDHIDVDAATDCGILVTNTARYNTKDVAQHTLALILEGVRKVRRLERQVRAGSWQCGALVQPTHRFETLTIGLVGFGKIGSALAGYARALGFRVIAHDPYVPPAGMIERGVTPVTYRQCLAEADVLTFHVPLTGETLHMLGAAELTLMKPTAVVINTSRGPVIDEAALIQALRAGHVAGAALDVLEREPPALDCPLLQMEQVIVTGHAAGTSQEGIQDWQDEWREIISAFTAGVWPINVLNPDLQPKQALSGRPATIRS
jgi:D-3-phosphoglycerate dehydrogenase / 2-oxoglutarate reductase